MCLSITNKTQHYTMVFIAINALHVSGGSSAYHQELKTVYTALGICRAITASYHASALGICRAFSASYHLCGKKLDKYPMLCKQF